MKYRHKILLGCCLSFILCSTHASDDPYQSFNRDVESFNSSIDRHALKPATESYVKVTPDPARQAISNVVNNLIEPLTITNDLLQGKFSQGVQDTARFIFNSTFGLFGLIDIATPMGLVKHDEDFGQTLATWGWQDSRYLNLPLLGPSTIRDATVKPLDLIMTNYGLPFAVVRILRTRESLLPTDPLLEQAPDRYLFVRDSYLQQRQYEITDGKNNKNKKLKDFDFSE